ncbi:hypothetical protein [Planomicrobium okeanokoites]|uniref:hypothetical protein n=1 Tax=Planomicrobium okeanokoites TaxID=244 RepID=UPI0024914667|nr:hypothetical protein [Planomicrobium okeanokoites]
MEDFIGYSFVALMLFGFGYALIWHIRDATEVHRSKKWNTTAAKRKLIANYLMVVSLGGFLVSYILNIAVGTLVHIRPEAVQHALINSDTTAFACFSSLVVYFISRFAIMPKEEENQRLLKAKI